jgi:hypothetical protein
MIIAGTVEVLLNHFARRMDPFSSVMAPRVYHQVFIQVHLRNSLSLSLSIYPMIPTDNNKCTCCEVRVVSAKTGI